MSSISQIKQRLMMTSEKLDDFEACMEKFSEWITMQEAKTKAFMLVATVEEKQDNVNMLQNLLKEVKENEAQLNDLLERQVNFLESQKSGSGNYSLIISRITLSTQQMTTRYHSLLATTEGLLKNALQGLVQHELYQKAYESAHHWLLKARQKFASWAGLINSKEDVLQKRVILQELSAEREEGLGLISQAAEAGEKLHLTTSADGRETIRQQIRSLKQAYEAFLDDILGSQREVEGLLVEWGSFEESLEQLGSWLDSRESVLEGSVPMHSTLEDKKMQLFTFRSLLQDILSYQRLIDGVASKAQSMAQTTNDLSIIPAMCRMSDIYAHLCCVAKERVDFYEAVVKDHLAYNSAVNSLRDWLNVVQEKLKLQQDITGDISEIRSRLEKIEASASLQKEGEAKLKKISDCSEKVIPNTLTEGQDVIFREVHDANHQLMQLQNDISKMKTELEKCVSVWKNFEQVENNCRTAMRNAEMQLRNVELQPTLATKREQLLQIRRLQEELSSYAAKIEELNVNTDILMKLTTDAPLSSHVDQLSTRFHNQLSVVKEAVTLWEKYVTDHQLFEDQKQNFTEWHRDALSRLKLCLPSKETKFSFEAKLSRLRELSAFKDEGFAQLENTVSRAEAVSRNTAAAGRDSINRNIVEFQGIIKDFVSSVNTTREKLELALLLHSSFSSSVMQLTEWLHNTEDEINLLEELPATLMEQKMQLEKANVLSLKILGQRSEVVLLKQTAGKLVDTGFDEKDVEIAETIGEKFSDISKRTQAIVKTCEKYVMEHLLFQDAFNKASEWLNITSEKLLSCSDVEGDCHVLMAKHEKLLDLLKMLPEGEIRLKEVTKCCDGLMKIISGPGQTKTREEVRLLTNDIEQRNAAIQEKSVQLKAAAQMWKQFNESYEEGSNWLRNLENKARQSFTLKSSLNDKQQALEDYRKFIGDIEGRADHFREVSRLSQVLLESCSDSGFVEQVAQFKSRYAALLEHSKNQLKILEHHVEDHKHFLHGCDAFTEWFNSVNSGLDEFLNVAREKEALQAQLKQFYEFSTRKEEAVVLMICADVYGKKTMLNTSAVGLSKITEKLNDMQHEWNSFLASLAETKARLEASLMKWSDVDSGINQLRCWMKEATRRLQEADLPSTLNERKAQLQRTKALQKEIACKEHSVAQLKAEAKQLGDVEKSLTSDIDLIVKEYETLNSQAMMSLSAIEVSLSQHVKLNEALEEFTRWLNSSEESLAACQADGNMESINSRIATLLKLEESLRVGDNLLQETLQIADLVYQNTSSAGCSRIKQELDAVVGDFDDFKMQLAASHKSLLFCKKLWEEYDTKKMSFFSWLKEIGSHFKADFSYGSSIQEKEMQFQTHQSYLDEILARQEELDSLNQKAKELQNNISSVHVVQEITEMLNSHQSLLYASQDHLRKFESAYHEHLQFNETSTEYDSWLEDIKCKVQSMENFEDERAELETKLAELALIESSLGKAHSKMLAITEQGNLVLFHSSPEGASIVRQEMKNLSEKFEHVKSDLMRGKTTLEGLIGSFSLFEYTWEKVNSWLQKTEESIRELLPQIQHGDLHEKRDLLDKMKLLAGHIESYKSELDNLSLLFAKLPRTTSLDASDPLHRWESLNSCASEQLPLLKQQIEDYECYTSTRTQLEHQLSKLNADVRNIETSESSISERLDKLKELKSVAAELVSKYEDVVAVGDKVVSSTSVEDAHRIQLELQKCCDTLASLRMTMDNLEEDFEVTTRDLFEYKECRVELLDWLEIAEEKLRNTIDNMDLSSLDQISTDIQTLSKEIHESRLLQNLLSKSDKVSQLFPEEGICDEVAALALQFASLQNDAKDDEEKVASFKKDVNLFVEMVAKHQERLIVAKQSLDKSRRMSGDAAEIELKFNMIQNLISEFCREEPLNDLTAQCQAILDRVKPEERVQIEEQLKDIQAEYNKLTDELNSTSDVMKSWIEKRDTYSGLLSSIERLLEENESEKDILNTSSDLSAHLDQLNRLKNYLSALNDREEEVTELSRLAEDLAAQQGRDEWKKEAVNLKQKFQNRRRQLEAIIKTLETSCSLHQNYNNIFNDCERRLVTMSLRFTAHKSVCIQTYEMTLLRLSEHKELMSELESYQCAISNIQELGQKVIATNPDSVDLNQETEEQITTITDTYSSLKTAANQIKDHLEGAVEHWQSCESLVDDCAAYINTQILQILHEDISSCSSIETVRLKIGETKDVLNKLQKFSQEILTALEKERTFICSDSSLHKDMEPTILLSPLQQKVQHVSKKLSDVLSRLSEHQGILKEAESKWLEVEKLKAQLKEWVSEKEVEIMTLSTRSFKLHPDSVEHEIRELERFLLELQEKGPTIEKLTIRYTRLIPNSAELVQDHVQPIKTLWESFVATLKEQIAKRREFLVETKSLHRKQARLMQSSNDLDMRIDQILADGTSAEEKKRRLQILMNENENLKLTLESLRTTSDQLMMLLSQSDRQTLENRYRSFGQKISSSETRIDNSIELCDKAMSTWDTLMSSMDSFIGWAKECFQMYAEQQAVTARDRQNWNQEFENAKQSIKDQETTVSEFRDRVKGLLLLPLGQQEKGKAQTLLMDCQKGIHEVNEKFQAIVKTVSMELQEQKCQKEIEEQKRLLELEEQKRLLEIERQKYLQELEEQKRLEELEEQKRLHELEKKHLKELEEQKRLQELEEQKRLAELEEQKRLEELEEQKRLKELEEQKRLKELEEQTRLQELEEQKRLKEHEQKRLQKIKELQDERKACCLPFIERLDLLGQKLAHISKQPSQPEKLEERMQQLEECQKDLKELETNLLTSKNEWSDVSIGEDGDDPFSAALSNLNTLKNEVRKCSDSYQQLIDDRREKQDELSKIVKRFDIVELWFHSAKTAALGKPVHTTSSRFQQEQLCDITNIYEELDARLQQLHDITDQLNSLPKCEDLKAESRLEEKLDSLKNNISNLKDTLAEKLKNLKEDTEKSEKKQKEMQNLEASLVDIQKKVSQMLRSNELPSKDDLEIWKQMPNPNRELQQMLEAEIQEQMELVKTVADQHDSLKAAPPEMNIGLPARSMWYTPLPLSVVTREPGSSRVLEAAIQMKVADLRKYWQNFKQNSDAGLEEYQCGQRKFGDLMSTAFQWLDCMEGQAARPTTAADLQDLQRQTKQFRLIYDELVEQQGVTGEIGQSLKDKLPASTAQQYMLSIRSLEDLDRRLALLEEEKRSKEHQAMERKEWQKNLENQVTDVEKEVHDYEQQYLSLSDGKMPCETRLTVAKQLDDDCKEGLHRLDALRTEVELRFIQDPAVAIPPELFSVRHHLINLHDKVAEKKVDLSRTTSSNVQYETLLEQYAEFLETAHEKVKAAAPSVSDLSQLKDQLFMHKEFFQDLVSHQTLLETIGRKVEPQEKERYHSSHARLNSLAHGVLDKANAHETRLKQAIDQWSEFGPQLNERAVWMGNIEKRLPRPTGKNDSIETLEQRLQDLQVIQRELEAEKGPISQAVDSGRQLLKLVACPALSRKLDDFVDRHKKLSDELVEELKSLEALVKLSKQFDSEADMVEQWVKAAGGQKDSIKKLLAKDVKQAEDSLLELKRDCEDYQSHKTSAVSLGNKLLRSRPSDTRVHNRLKLISDNWLTLLNDVADVETKVQDTQRALLPSRQALVELLQWLDTVQRSITQDGSTRPRNREDVRQLLKKYKLLKGDLTHRLLNIEYVNKSAEQIQGSKQASHMDQALSAERLGEMNKQYQSLCSDVDNKVIKLEMACDTWKEYETAVQNLRDWLESESVRISQEEKNLNGIAVEPILKNCKHVADALKGEKAKDLESVKCLGSALMKSSDWPANAESINSVLETLSHQCKLVEDKLNNLQRLAEDRKRLLDDYNLALNDVNDTVDHTQTSLNKLQQTSGFDSANLKEQVVKLQGLQKDFEGSKESLRKLSSVTSVLVSDLDPVSSKTVQDDQKKALDRWQKLKGLISERLSDLETLSSNWNSYNDEYNSAFSWLNKKGLEIERLLQNELPEDKDEKLRDITTKQQELIAFRSKLSDLEAMSKELLPSLDSARVVYILSNQTSLKQQADSLQQLVERRLQNFGSVEDNREKFTELCQKVEALLKEAKDGLTKASLPYNSSDQEVVQERLKLVKNLSGEFTQMNPNFTELNHTGYRLPLSKADSDRLKKINDQWQELHSECCEQHKKLQQQLLLLQSFADKCEEWNSFLAEVENYLKGGICGNYNSVLEQQQKLEAFQQDVFPHQQILYSIISDGHEMMENSRGNSGAEDFGRKLQLLEEQWQTIVRQANRRKALVDNIVTLWQTYREMIDELSGTIGRVRKFVDSHPVIPDTFSSVRHHVDEYKDFHNQLNALQPLIDKLQSYSLLLSPNSDSTTVNQLEFEVKLLEDEAKNLSGVVDSNMKQLEDTLALWEITQSNLESFVAWMKEIKSFLTPDVPKKYNTLVKELEKLESLQSDRSDQCDELTKNLEQLTQFITPEDALILCQRLRLLTKQQSEVSRQIADRCQVVRDRLNRWAEFDKNSDALLAACASFEKKIDNLDDLSIEDAISEIQNDLQLEMERLEGCKEELTGIGNELRRNSQDLRASDIEHKIANINDKCSRLQEILNERVNKLTVALGTLQQLEKKIKDLRWWLLRVEHLLTSPTVYETCSNAEIQHQLKEQLALQKDIDDHNLPVVSVLNLCETLSSDKIACPSALEGRSIRQARDLLESRWRKINTMSTERKKLIEETGQLWQKFNNAHQEFTVWLKVVERQVVNPKTHGATFKALKEERTAIQKLQVDVQKKLSDLDSLNRLYCRLAHEGRTDARKFLKKKIDDANLRWDCLLARAAAIVKRLSHIISIKADFDAHHLALVIWLSSFNDVLTELEQLAAGPPNAKILNFIKKELASNSVRLEYIDRASRYLMQRCEPSDAALIQQHVDEFHALHESILCQLKRLENRLHLAAGPDAIMDDEQSRGKIRQLETQLEGSRKNISSSQIHDAVGRLEVNVDDDWDSSQGQGMHPDWEEDAGSRITGGYSLLGDESVLVELANLEGWLCEANATLDSEKKSPQDMAQFNRCLKKHCALKEQIKTWKPRVFRIRSALSPIAHHTQFTEELCDRISTVIAKWDRVCQRMSDWFIRLQLQLMQSDELHMSIEDLAFWVEDVRMDLDFLDLEKPADYTTPMSVVEAKRKKLMMVERDLKDIHVNLDFLRDIVEYFLQDSTSDAAVEDRDELAKIADDLEALQDAYSNHQTMLEGVGGKSFEHSLMSGDHFSQSSVFPLGSSGRRIPRYAHPSAGKQKRQEQPTKGAADLTTHDTASYLGLLKRACRTAIPIQLMMLLLIGVASLVPMCENECILNALDPLLKYADGSPPL